MYRYTTRSTAQGIRFCYLRPAGCARVSSSGPTARSIQIGLNIPMFKRADVSIYYEEYGTGYPILLFAPGGMRSSIEFWANGPFDPTKEFAANFRVIAMDQ